jgi:hypothetical protein
MIDVLEKIMKEWDFLAIDTVGNSRGILTGWKKSIPLPNSFFLASGIWIEFLF